MNRKFVSLKLKKAFRYKNFILGGWFIAVLQMVCRAHSEEEVQLSTPDDNGKRCHDGGGDYNNDSGLRVETQACKCSTPEGKSGRSNLR